MKRVQVKMPDELYEMAKITIGDGNLSSFIRDAITTYINRGGDKQIIKTEK